MPESGIIFKKNMKICKTYEKLLVKSMVTFGEKQLIT